MNNKPFANIKKILIVGGGTAGWMAASTLSRCLRGNYHIQLIESDDIATVGVGEPTIPQIKLFNQVLGLNEAEFLKRTQGTIKLGIQFNDWGKIGDSYMHAFGPIGAELGMIDFHHYWLRSIQQGGTSSLWDYSFNQLAAQQNRFQPVEHIGNTRLAGLVNAYHFDATLFARYLRSYSEEAGVIRTEGKVVSVNLQPDNGFIQSVVMASGEAIDADFFIDCSGFRGLLIEGALKTGYEDWSQWLPCDRAVVVPSAAAKSLRPYTQATAQAAGWQWRIPLQERTGNGHVYASKYLSDDEAATTLLENLDGAPLAEPRIIKFTTGKRKKIWNKNCLALGLASGFMEPLESTSIHLVQHSLLKLIELFPTQEFCGADVDEFNRQLDREFETIRDFLILHYHATERSDSEFWNHCRTMNVPDSLTRKMDLFKSHGRAYREGNELFSEVAWLQVMHGQGINPQGYHPLADLLTTDQLNEFLFNINSMQIKARDQLSGHREYLTRFGAAH